MNKKLYRAPQMELHALRVEKGFAGSIDDDSQVERLSGYGLTESESNNFWSH